MTTPRHRAQPATRKVERGWSSHLQSILMAFKYMSNLSYIAVGGRNGVGD